MVSNKHSIIHILHQIHNVVLTHSYYLNSLDIGQFEKQIYKPNTEKKEILCKEKLPSSIGKFGLSRLGPFDVLSPKKYFLIIWLSNILTFNVSEESYPSHVYFVQN